MTLTCLDEIYVLNVKNFKERRKHIQQQLYRLGLEAQFIFDYDVSDLEEEVTANFFHYNTELSLPQKSIAMKHVRALELIVERGQRRALVLEDDVILSKNFKVGIEKAVVESYEHPQNQVIFIGCGGNFYTPQSSRQCGQSLYINKRGRFADSYIIGTSAASLRLKWITSNKIEKPIDNQFEEIDNEVGITILWLEDPVVEQGSKTGIFSTQLEPALPRFIQRLKFFLEKIRRKYIYQMWR